MGDGLDTLHDGQQLLPQLGAELGMVCWFHGGQSILLGYNSGNQAQTRVKQSRGLYSEPVIKSQIIRYIQTQMVIKIESLVGRRSNTSNHNFEVQGIPRGNQSCGLIKRIS